MGASGYLIFFLKNHAKVDFQLCIFLAVLMQKIPLYNKIHSIRKQGLGTDGTLTTKSNESSHGPTSVA